jgi:hypothetical protein
MLLALARRLAMECTKLSSFALYSFVAVIGVSVLYGGTYMSFVHAHSRVGLIGPPGRAMTSGYLGLPDTRFNRALAMLYSPLLQNDTIEWEEP